MRKFCFYVVSLVAVSFLSSCVLKPDPTPNECTLTINLLNCNIEGASSVYTHKYTKGTSINPLTVSPDINYTLNENSISSGFKSCWVESTNGSYILSGLVMNDNYLINIGAFIGHTLTVNLDHCSIGGEKTYTHVYEDGKVIQPLTISPDKDCVLDLTSVSDEYRGYWQKGDELSGSYVLSGLVMNDDCTINVSAGNYIIQTDTSGISFSPSFLLKNEEYNGTITITSKNKLLPESPTSVVVDDGTSTKSIDTYEYTLLEGRKSAKISIPAYALTGNVKVTIGPVNESEVWYNRDDWWNYCSNGVAGRQALAIDIGQEVRVNVNGLLHRVKLIDIDRDETPIEDESYINAPYVKIHCTFEFVDVISDSNGFSLASFWEESKSDEYANHDYLNSSLRKNLIGYGGGTGTAGWYVKNGTEKSREYMAPVLSMLPDDLENAIRPARKWIYKYNTVDKKWEKVFVTDKLFLLSPREMGYTPEDGTGGNEGEPYTYYEEHKEKKDIIRFKQQLNGPLGALNKAVTLTDRTDPDVGYSYAGYNDERTLCSTYWFRSPRIDDNKSAWYIDNNCDCSGTTVYQSSYAHPVAPAFCI